VPAGEVTLSTPLTRLMRAVYAATRPASDRVVGEVGAQDVADRPRGRAGVDDPVVRVAEVRLEERRTEHEQDRGDRQTEDGRAAHHAAGEPVPETALHRLGSRRRTAEHPAQPGPQVEGVDPPSDERQAGRQHEDRRDGGHRHDAETRVGEGAQEVHREHDHGRHRQPHDERREQHGAPGGPHRGHDRVLGVPSLAQLLAVAAHHEQAVVDGQGQPQGGRHVHGVDRHVGEAGEGAQDRERLDDREDADRQRDESSDHTSEHEDERDRGQRDGHRLGDREVLLRLVVHLVVGHGGAAGADLRPARGGAEPVGQLPRPRLDLVVVAADVGDDQAVAAVLAAQRRRLPGRARPVRRREGQPVRPPLEALLDAGAVRAGGGAVGPAGSGHEEHQVGLAAGEPGVDDLGGPGRVGRRIGEAAGQQVARHRRAERRAGDQQQGGGDEDPLRVPDGEPGDSGEHGNSSAGSRAEWR
jgi:hypothetical protein